jgi:hypothetical protein
MSVFVGQLYAYLKIGAVAFCIMGAFWLVIRYVEKKGRENNKDDNPAA